jgi:hypothetical protein
MPNMNKIRPTVQELSKRAYREMTFQKKHIFHIRVGWGYKKHEGPSKCRDQYFHNHKKIGLILSKFKTKIILRANAENKKKEFFAEELIAYFHLIRHVPHRKPKK